VTNYLEPISLGDYTYVVTSPLNRTGIKFDENVHYMLAGHSAHKIKYSIAFQSSSLYIMEVWTVINNTAYHMSYQALEPKFTKYLPTIEQMLNSLQINH
jgi:hypothetical protein